jgi:ribonuclease P/MRP protein subunit RPP1
VKTALKNGCVFEVCYAGALGEVPASDSAAEEASAGGASIKRNWWAGAREVVRVIKGKGNHMVISGGVASEANLRAPRDIGNL